MFTATNDLMSDPAGTLAELKRLGVDTVHVYMHWADIAPDASSPAKPRFDATNPAAYPAASWSRYDAIVRDIKAMGMSLELDLVPPPPRWAEGRGAPQPASQPEWEPSAAEYGQWVRAVGTRYSGQYIPPGSTRPLPRVDFWSIWNEPNLGIELAPEAVKKTGLEVAPRLYRALLNAAWNAFQATGHGHDTILIGELAPAGVSFQLGQFQNMPPLRFLRALYCVNGAYHPLTGAAASERGCPTTATGSKAFAAQNPAMFKASGFADHPYPQGLPPDEPTPGEPDYAELAEIPKLEHVLDTLQRVYGSATRFPIYSTEFGYQTKPPDTEAGVVSPPEAAVYLNWSEYLTWLDPRIRTYDQYLLEDDAGGFFASGLRFSSGQPKPGYAAFRMPIFLPVQTTSQGHYLEVWGCVRPAHYAQLQTHRIQHVRIQFQPASGGAFRTVATLPVTNAHGYIDVLEKFPSSGNVRLAWKYPNGERITSRTVQIKLS
jgi:hypothetical protein